MDLASPWIHAQSNTNSNAHACMYCIHTYIKWYTTKSANNLQSEGMVTLTNKQTPAGTHSYTQHLGDGQLRKYARPSFMGSECRSKHNSKHFPCCHLLYFLCLRKLAQEVQERFSSFMVWSGTTAALFFFPRLPLGARCWLRGKVVARWDPTCPLGKMICKFGNVGSFAAVWRCLIGPDWRLIWLA